VNRSTGLRTEIIVNMVFLIGASLLLTGFLVLKYHERELLLRRVESVILSLELVADSLSQSDSPIDRLDEVSRQMNLLSRSFSASSEIRAWVYVDASLNPLASSGGVVPSDRDDLVRAKRSEEVVVRTSYPSVWQVDDSENGTFCLVTIPLFRYGEVDGLLQARFPLEDVLNSVSTARRLVFLYALLYGTILTLFGLWLLNRAVVRPVLRLSEGTRLVAGGDLSTLLTIEGPGEIAAMAESFNTMMLSLQKSRSALDAHIDSLTEANEILEKTREDLVRSEKMAAVGHLAAGMAHEIGNPLTALSGYLEYLRGEPLTGDSRDVIDRALAETQRIDRLVKDLLDYSMPVEEEFQRVNAVSVMLEACDLLSAQGAFDDVRVARDLPDSLADVVAFRHKLLQVFINLLLNARDASPAGTIHLTATRQGEWVRFIISDEGEGIDPETLPRLFDPFFTTKAPGKGRGLGLFISHRIIEEMNGQIVVESEKGRGSSFEVRLRPWSAEHEA